MRTRDYSLKLISLEEIKNRSNQTFSEADDFEINIKEFFFYGYIL